MNTGSIFYKMSGSGNDFLIFDGRYNHLDEFTSERIRALCDRCQGAGADGVILLAPEAVEGAHFTFHFWNSDGSRGPMCGNGALCATRLATLVELAPAEGDVHFSTLAGRHAGRVVGGRPQISLPDCGLPMEVSGLPAEAAAGKTSYLLNPSVPHLVIPVDRVETVELERHGPTLRCHPATGEGGANVNWVAPVGDGAFRMRTFERGVEGETLACGTGAVACAIVLEQLGMTRSPVRIWTQSGLPLDIAFKRTSSAITSVTLTGEGRMVYRGVVGESPSPASA